MESNTFIPLAFAALAVFLPLVILTILFQKNAKRIQELKQTATRLGLEFQDGLAKLQRKSLSPATGKNPDTAMQELGPTFRRLLRPESFLGKWIRVIAPWQIKGDYRSWTVQMDPVARGSGKSKSYYTRATVFYKKPLGLGLSVSSEGFLDRLSRKLQSKSDIELGDPDIDRRIQIQATDAQRARALLQDRPLREAFLLLLDRYVYGELLDDRTTAELKGTVSEEGHLRELLDALVLVAERIDLQGRF